MFCVCRVVVFSDGGHHTITYKYFIFNTLCLKQNIYFTVSDFFLSAKLDHKLGLVLNWMLKRGTKRSKTYFKGY